MSVRSRRQHGYLAFALALMLALASAAPQVALAATPPQPDDCAPILPKRQIEAGMIGRGWTVARGSRPAPFHVRVLGVQRNGIAPGHDLIVVKISDIKGSSMIANAGGIWAGMSGSPVYVEGKLIGAVAYRFAAGGAIGGLTTASDMMKVLEYRAEQTSASDPQANRLTLSGAISQIVAEESGVAESQAGELARLALPVSVSGLSPSGIGLLQERLAALGTPVVLTSGSRAPVPSGSSSFVRPVPGGNFAGIISYGDVTAGGIGTTTYVCGKRALAFGHPLTWAGPSTLGANHAQALHVVADPVFGPCLLYTSPSPRD